jgi:esterase/lipase
MGKELNLKSKSDKEFFMVHGYTGSLTDFGNLPEQLHKKFNANVRMILLRGHGTKIQDLDSVKYKDFITQVEEALVEDLKKGRKIVLVGVSFGAQLVLHLSTKYNVEGVISISPPYKFRFPFYVPGLGLLGLVKKYWKKSISEPELEKRKQARGDHYEYMHHKGLGIVKKASRDLKKRFHKLDCPCLIIFSNKERVGHYKSIRAIEKRVSSKISKKIISEKVHNLFYSPSEREIRDEIFTFVGGENLFKKHKKKKDSVAAIVPAYNEEKRIGRVLEVLLVSKVIDEIVVIDDGSSDDTASVVWGFMKKHKKIRFIQNQKNLGKSASMEKGVKATNAEIIFFCDADLINFSPEIVEGIVNPVQLGLTDMFIGLRKNFMQGSIHLFAINSGERALKRKTWEDLPIYFKKRYRVEAGLNHLVKRKGKGFSYKTFDYSQPTKEKKYGFWRGFGLRWWMNFDVGVAYARSMINNLFRTRKR